MVFIENIITAIIITFVIIIIIEITIIVKSISIQIFSDQQLKNYGHTISENYYIIIHLLVKRWEDNIWEWLGLEFAKSPVMLMAVIMFSMRTTVKICVISVLCSVSLKKNYIYIFFLNPD